MIITVKTVADVIYYILKKVGKADKLKIIKLIYLADKYHLVKYGRTITGDDYYAMERGPVATTAKDLLSFDRVDVFSPSASEYVMALITQTDREYEFAIKDSDFEPDTLSDTNREILDFVIEKFGYKTTSELIEYTHHYPEWKKYEKQFENGLIRRARIETVEMLTILDSDKDLGVDEKSIESIKQKFSEKYTSDNRSIGSLSSKIEDMYAVRDNMRESVRNFLNANEYLIPILEEAPMHIKRIFGNNAEIHLDLHDDPEENEKTLFIVIKSNHSPEEAVELEGKFFNEWFSKIIHKAKGKLGYIEQSL